MKTVKVMGLVGTDDPENKECRRVLGSFGIPCAQALFPGVSRKQAVDTRQAYDKLITFDEQVPTSVRYMIFIECAVPEALRARAAEIGAQIIVCDHHNPGDPGFDMPPKDFLKGSSLGQLLGHCGIEANSRQKIIAALDHCLSAAARGECPGVDPGEAFVYRNTDRAEWRKISHEAILEEVAAAGKMLAAAPRIVVGNEEVVCLTNQNFVDYKEIPTAAAWFNGKGIGYSYERFNWRTRTQKYGIMGVRPETVKYWKDHIAPNALQLPALHTYGCAARGYAGGYAS